jgi:hypothetical protein
VVQDRNDLVSRQQLRGYPPPDASDKNHCTACIGIAVGTECGPWNSR